MAPTGDATVDDVLVAAVCHGLDGGARWPGEPLGDATFARLIDAGLEQRLLGALAEAVSDRALRLTAEQLTNLNEQHRMAQVHMLNLERVLLQVAERFRAKRIDFRVLKGVALSHLLYANPSWRMAADVDLLIPSDQFDEAVATVIDDLGGTQRIPELRFGFDREFGKESMVRIGRLEVDLHRTFVTGAFGLTIALDDLFAEGTDFVIGGQTFRALGAEHLFLHACYNAALGDYPVRLSAIRDLLLCKKQVEVDVGRLTATARRWGAVAVLRRAAELVIETTGPSVAGDFVDLAGLDVPRREAWLLSSYLTSSRSYSRPLAALAVIPGIRPRLRYARAIIAPSETYLRSRGWTGRGHAARAVRRFRDRG